MILLLLSTKRFKHNFKHKFIFSVQTMAGNIKTLICNLLSLIMVLFIKQLAPILPNRIVLQNKKFRMTRAMMIDSHVTSHYWPKAISTANYLTNSLPTKSLKFDTPLNTLKSYTSVPTSHSLSLWLYCGCPSSLKGSL